jgi:hypothetical protein
MRSGTLALQAGEVGRLTEGYRQRGANDDDGHEHRKGNASTIVVTGLVSHGNTSPEAV